MGRSNSKSLANPLNEGDLVEIIFRDDEVLALVIHPGDPRPFPYGDEPLIQTLRPAANSLMLWPRDRMRVLIKRFKMFMPLLEVA